MRLRCASLMKYHMSLSCVLRQSGMPYEDKVGLGAPSENP